MLFFYHNESSTTGLYYCSTKPMFDFQLRANSSNNFPDACYINRPNVSLKYICNPHSAAAALERGFTLDLLKSSPEFKTSKSTNNHQGTGKFRSSSIFEFTLLHVFHVTPFDRCVISVE